MENTLNHTLHNLVDYATEKLFSNATVEEAKDKATSYFPSSKKSASSNALLYTGLALAAAGAAYLVYKNRDVIREKVLDFADQLEAMKNNLENEQEHAMNA